MQSRLMTRLGLRHWIAGSDYNFRRADQGQGPLDPAPYQRALEAAGFSGRPVYSGHQVHGRRVAYCPDPQAPVEAGIHVVPETDGLITDQAGLCLMVKYADCSPIILYDPVNRLVALLHSGWRGTLQGIARQALRQMQEDFHCDLQGVHAYIGPSISQDHYEVGQEVYEAFLDRDFPQAQDIFRPGAPGKYSLSMKEANRQLLIASGVPPVQIEVAEEDTFTDPRLHSARQEGADYQLNGLFVSLD